MNKRQDTKAKVLVFTLSMIFIFLSGFSVLGQEYDQAPMLDKLVEEGKLPPVEERLPKNPIVVEPISEVGKYGGTLQRVFIGTGSYLFGNIDKQPLLRQKQDRSGEIIKPSGVTPNLIESLEFSPDAKSATIHLLEGLKWSNGDPYTADDIEFMWNDLILDDNFPAPVPGGFKAGGKLPKFKKIDEYTVRFTWDTPYMAFRYALTYDPGVFLGVAFSSDEILKELHPKHNDAIDDYEQIISKLGGGMGATVELAQTVSPELPTLSAWDVVEFEPGQRVVLERNPYFPQIDTEGNQLPYIDRIVGTHVSSTEVAALKVTQGKVDAQSTNISLGQIPLLMEHAEEGNYSVLIMPNDTPEGLYLNRDSPNEQFKSLVRNKDFRVALSLAIDRTAIADIVFRGFAEPVPYSVHPLSQFYPEGIGKPHIGYQPDKARELLDNLGLKDKNNDGIREFNNGKPVELLGYGATEKQARNDMLELVKEQWAKVGIKLNFRLFEVGTVKAKMEEDFPQDIAIWGVGGAMNPLIRGDRFAPVGLGGAKMWAPQAYYWYSSGGERGHEPRGLISESLDLYQAAKSAVSASKQEELLKDLARLHAEEVINIGLVLSQRVFVKKNNIGNIRKMVMEAENMLPQQWYFK